MKIYIRAYWYDEGESADDFIYKPDGSSNTDYEEEDELYEVLPDDPYEGSTGYGDFDDFFDIFHKFTDNYTINSVLRTNHNT